MLKKFNKNGICKFCIIKDSCMEKCSDKRYEEFKEEANRLKEVFSKWVKQAKQ